MNNINKRRIRGKNIIIFAMGFILFIMIISISIVNSQKIIEINKKVLYCEMSNLNARMANELMPYFDMYLDESIETIGEVNKTLSHLLKLRFVGKREMELPQLDCPKSKCNYYSASPLNGAVCDMIEEIREKQTSFKTSKKVKENA